MQRGNRPTSLSALALACLSAPLECFIRRADKTGAIAALRYLREEPIQPLSAANRERSTLVGKHVVDAKATRAGSKKKKKTAKGGKVLN